MIETTANTIVTLMCACYILGMVTAIVIREVLR